MRFLELSLGEPRRDLALDEALLEWAEETQDCQGILRVWEPSETLVVLGRGSKVAEEVELERCRQAGVPVLRRCSGGATVVTGPGCLMYAVVLSYDSFPELRALDEAHRFVMQRLMWSLDRLGIPSQMQGTCDLTISDRKVSGNSLRVRRTHFLYHGTLLYEMDLECIDRLLRMPPRRPEYRADRAHRDFVARIEAPRESLVAALREIWEARELWTEAMPLEAIERIVRERLADDAWNLRL